MIDSLNICCINIAKIYSDLLLGNNQDVIHGIIKLQCILTLDSKRF